MAKPQKKSKKLKVVSSDNKDLKVGVCATIRGSTLEVVDAIINQSKNEFLNRSIVIDTALVEYVNNHYSHLKR